MTKYFLSFLITIGFLTSFQTEFALACERIPGYVPPQITLKGLVTYPEIIGNYINQSDYYALRWRSGMGEMGPDCRGHYVYFHKNYTTAILTLTALLSIIAGVYFMRFKKNRH